jgi:catechol 2,3-dioxygenase-like lactoylglutathione lyase family enzyme
MEERSMIHCLGHVGLGVKDLERSLEFYRDFLGMEVIMQLEVNDDRMGRVIGCPGARCRIAHLKLGPNVLELFEYSYPRGRDNAHAVQQYDVGLIHIGFEVQEFHDLLKRLRTKGVQFLGEPVEFRPGVWVLYFRGPDGEVCEFRQQPLARHAEKDSHAGV